MAEGGGNPQTGAKDEVVARAGGSAGAAAKKATTIDPTKTITIENMTRTAADGKRRDPWFKEEIEEITEIEDGCWVVWLTKDKLSTYWLYEEQKGQYELPDCFDAVAARLAQFEAIPIGTLDESTRKAFRTLVAAGLARAMRGNASMAAKLHDQAEEFIKARLAEQSRLWCSRGVAWWHPRARWPRPTAAGPRGQRGAPRRRGPRDRGRGGDLRFRSSAAVRRAPLGVSAALTRRIRFAPRSPT